MGKISLQMYTMRAHTQTLSDLEKTIEKLAEIGFKMLQYSIPEAYDAKAVYDIFEKNGITNDSVFTPFLKIEENTKTILEQCELFQTDYGREIILKQLASSGKQIIGITVIQSIGTFLFVSLVFLLYWLFRVCLCIFLSYLAA